jgi:hypothetical protein
MNMLPSIGSEESARVVGTGAQGGDAPLRRVPWSARRDDRPWPRATHVLLVAAGVLLACFMFATVMRIPDLPYHPARDAELRATYDTYVATGVPLVKENGTGSWYGTVPGEGLTKAAGDDDPGSYLIASWMSHLTGSTSPYPGLRWVMAVLCALPMLLLPVTVARVFRRARAGLAMLALPLVTWLVNDGAVLVGTEYGLYDPTSFTRVYALYGLPASLIFGSLVLLAYAVTRRRSWPAVVGFTLALLGLAVVSNLLRSMSGLGIALAVGALWWVAWKGRARWAVAAAVSVLCGLFAMWLPGVAMGWVDASRDRVVSAEVARLPSAHGVWHPLYLGLSYPQPINGEPSRFDVLWSDEFGWQKAREVDPGVVVASDEYDAIIKDLFLDEVRAAPVGVVRLYAAKTLYTVKHFAALIVLIGVAALLLMRREGPHRPVVALLAIATVPMMLLAMVPPVLVMPMVFYYTELIAVLGFLSALALGGLAWAVSTFPSVVRVREREIARERGLEVERGSECSLSVIIPSRNGEAVLPDTLEQFARVLGPTDELIVVENGSTDDTAGMLRATAESWPHAFPLRVLQSEPGLGNALRTGVLASRGERLLLTDDDLPFGFSDLNAFRRLPTDVVLAIGSKAHPASTTPRSTRRQVQSRVFRWLRSALLHSVVGDSQGTTWVDGRWARSFAAVSRETGLIWTVELVLAAEEQGIEVWELPVVLDEAHDDRASRFRPRDACIAVLELMSLAARRDDYTGQEWITPGAVMSKVSEETTTAGSRSRT